MMGHPEHVNEWAAAQPSEIEKNLLDGRVTHQWRRAKAFIKNHQSAGAIGFAFEHGKLEGAAAFCIGNRALADEFQFLADVLYQLDRIETDTLFGYLVGGAQ